MFGNKSTDYELNQSVVVSYSLQLLAQYVLHTLLAGRRSITSILR